MKIKKYHHNDQIAPLPLARFHADSIIINDEISLVDDETDQFMGTMKVEEKYSYDKNHEAKNVFRTNIEECTDTVIQYLEEHRMILLR